MERIREHVANHYCLTSLNLGEVDLDDEFTIVKINGDTYNSTIESHLTDTFIEGGFCSTVSQSAEKEWKEAWEQLGAESGYSEYLPTPEEKFNWQDVETMAREISVGSDILLNFLCNTLPRLELHDFEVEWEDETDEHCRTFLLVSPD